MAAEEFELPPEVTPALRAACEKDVRRLCIGQDPTIQKVKSCVEQRFAELNSRCKLALAAAGFSRAVVAQKTNTAAAGAGTQTAGTQIGRSERNVRTPAAPALRAPGDGDHLFRSMTTSRSD